MRGSEKSDEAKLGPQREPQERVLLVEDNAANRKLMGGILRRAGYAVHAVDNASDGIRLARRQGFALVIMDIQLPGIDGMTAARTLRADPACRSVPILAVTAYAMLGDEQEILESGCDAYLAKPVSYKELLAVVARLLASSDDTPHSRGER